MFENILFNQNKKIVDSCINFFTSEITNPIFYDRIVKKCRENQTTYLVDGKKTHPDPNYLMKLQMGYLSITNYLNFYSNEIPMLVLEKALDRLSKIGVCSPVNIFQGTNKYDTAYALHHDYVSFLHKNNAIDNRFYDFLYIIKKYKNSIYKIIVEEDQTPSIGTGFLIKLKDKHLVLTNKHVLENKQNITIEATKGEVLEYSEVKFSATYDLAMIELRNVREKDQGFNLLCEYSLLDEIITIGYPKVAMTKDSYQLVHKGEINAQVSDYYGHQNIIFSAKTAPGNSGGPLINRYGLVAGIVTKELFSQEIDSSYFAAIPAVDILNFVNESI